MARSPSSHSVAAVCDAPIAWKRSEELPRLEGVAVEGKEGAVEEEQLLLAELALTNRARAVGVGSGSPLRSIHRGRLVQSPGYACAQ